MARIRAIKPEFFKHLELQELENSYAGQNIMLVYAGLWTQCDKNGVFFCNAKVLKNEILPYINFDMQKTLDILEKEKYFIKYKNKDREYGFIPNFCKYQFPSLSEKNSPAKYPEPPIRSTSKDSTETVLEQFQDEFETVPSTSKDSTEPEGLKEKGKRKKDTDDFTDGSNEPPSVFENSSKLKTDMTEPIKLANLLLTSHRKEYPDYLSGKDTKKITGKWAEDIEKLIRIDKKPPETIRQVILWVKTAGNFWFQNIESGKKLREKFERLHGQMIERGKKTDPPEKNKGNSYILDAEESDKLLAEMANRERAENADLSGELKKVAGDRY